MINQQHRYIAYYRVSTARQGASGLGLEAQQKSVSDYVNYKGGQLLKEYTEVESGRKADRLQLNAALKASRLHQATLVIAKLDRLARNATFLLNLQDSDADFVCCDMPDANRLTIGILALVAEQEAQAISRRTKEALAAAKRRGVKLGVAGTKNLRNRELGSQRGIATRMQQAEEKAKEVGQEILPLVEQGLSLRAIATHLNDSVIPTSRNGQWSAVQVKRVIDRLGFGIQKSRAACQR